MLTRTYAFKLTRRPEQESSNEDIPEETCTDTAEALLFAIVANAQTPRHLPLAPRGAPRIATAERLRLTTVCGELVRPSPTRASAFPLAT